MISEFKIIIKINIYGDIYKFSFLTIKLIILKFNYSIWINTFVYFLFINENKLLNIIQNIKITTNYLISKGFDEKKIIKNNLAEDSIIFDIGSNLGSFIRFISKNNKKIKIYRFIHLNLFQI